MGEEVYKDRADTSPPRSTSICARWAHRRSARPDAASTARLIDELRSGSRNASRFADPVRETWSRCEGPRAPFSAPSAAREAPAV